MTGMFLPQDSRDVLRLINDYPLAWVVSIGAGGGATPLPLLAELDDCGEVTALFGHFARSNQQVAALERDPRAMILFQGPNDYVPARIVSVPTWGPTWNYAVIRYDVEITFVPEETEASVERLAAALERDRADPWTTDRMGDRRAAMLRAIIAFRARVTAAHPRFKLGQDESPDTFDEIVAGIDNPALAAWMVRIARGG